MLTALGNRKFVSHALSRKHDYFQHLVEDVNRLEDSYRDVVVQLTIICQSLKEKVATTSDPAAIASVDELLDILESYQVEQL